MHKVERETKYHSRRSNERHCMRAVCDRSDTVVFYVLTHEAIGISSTRSLMQIGEKGVYSLSGRGGYKLCNKKKILQGKKSCIDGPTYDGRIVSFLSLVRTVIVQQGYCGEVDDSVRSYRPRSKVQVRPRGVYRCNPRDTAYYCP